MAAPLPRFRPDVSMPGLLATVRSAFASVTDTRRQASVQYSMPDALMAGLVIYSLKYPSRWRWSGKKGAQQCRCTR